MPPRRRLEHPPRHYPRPAHRRDGERVANDRGPHQPPRRRRREWRSARAPAERVRTRRIPRARLSHRVVGGTTRTRLDPPVASARDEAVAPRAAANGSRDVRWSCDVRHDLERLHVPPAPPPGERRARRGRRRGNSTRRSGGVAPGRRPTNHRDGRVSRPSRVRRRSRRRRRGGMDRLRPGAPRTRRRGRRNRDRNRVFRNRVFLPRGARLRSEWFELRSAALGARAPARRTFVFREGPDARGGAHLALARVGPGEDGVRERGARGRVGRGRAAGARGGRRPRAGSGSRRVEGRRSRMVVRDPGRLRGRARGGLRVRRRGGE